jgi:hypothetical protein
MRETLAVADLIKDDVIVATGEVVTGFPHGIKGLPGTLLPIDSHGLIMGVYYSDSETPISIIR